MKYKYILAIDPSGNYKEGFGTTGWVLINYKGDLLARGCIEAKQYSCAEEYWNAHLDLLKRYINEHGRKLIVVIEEYRLYRQRAQNQTNSLMETPRLIGLIQWLCWNYNQTYSMQLASSVKQRWADGILLQEGYFGKRNNYIYHKQSNISLKSEHVRDAFRHAIHYAVTRNETKPKEKQKNKGARKHAKSNYKSRRR